MRVEKWLEQFGKSADFETLDANGKEESHMRVEKWHKKLGTIETLKTRSHLNDHFVVRNVKQHWKGPLVIIDIETLETISHLNDH